jgi:hypothetical protein
MSDVQLQNSPEREIRIRKCAYYLWEADGCPHGRDREYWQRAEALISREDSAAAGQSADPLNKPDAVSGAKAKTAQTRASLERRRDNATDQPARSHSSRARGPTRNIKATTIRPDEP